MYYKDLTPYDYGFTNYKNALNIGWLERGYEFQVGDFPEKQEVIEKLKLKKRENLYRGAHSCEFCDRYERESGNGEYIVMWNKKVYSAPTLIIHYIEIHNYKPPQEFIDAVINEK